MFVFVPFSNFPGDFTSRRAGVDSNHGVQVVKPPGRPADRRPRVSQVPGQRAAWHTGTPSPLQQNGVAAPQSEFSRQTTNLATPLHMARGAHALPTARLPPAAA
jgi:hypothetical protein